MEYNFKEIEKKWQQYWANNKTFAAKNNSDKPKYYSLDMFPYPSGAGLHVGHPLGYIASDIVSRYKRLTGYNVLHPMGYDSFGLPAEQYAIQTGQHPAITTEQNIKRYREQLDKIGFSFDWDCEVRTSDPSYYKWTQWIFIQLFNSWYNPHTNKAEHIDTLISVFEKEGFSGPLFTEFTGDIEHEIEAFTAADWKAFDEKKRSAILMNFRIAYLGEAYVNWCPQLGTVLANDEVKDGVSERGGYPVERKMMKQWSMRITKYAQRLLDGLNKIDWSDSLKESQRNWIGRSEGTSLEFKIQNSEFKISVFTTRPDTIFGVSFVTLAPEHELIEKITTPEFKKQVDEYVAASKNRSERERQADVKKVSGQFTGAYVLHPFTGKQIPIYVGDYVLAGYGTGAVMAVPAHDERDHRFAKHFNLPILKVIQPPDSFSYGEGGDEASYDGKEGKLINSDFLNGLEVKEAIKKAIEAIEKKSIGKGKINFRLRDAVFGRQRYWGEPIPIYYKDGIPHALPENELPLVLPEVDKFLPTETGEPPLARAKDWKYKGQYDYEHSTMPGWAGSSWYYLRYMDANNAEAFVSKDAANYWQNIDLYLGGSEHATGHLLYVRFWTMFLKDMGYINFDEPAKKLINQGMIQGTSQYISEVLLDPKRKAEYDAKEKNLTLVIVNEQQKKIGELAIKTIAHKHIYKSVDCKYSFYFLDKASGEKIDAIVNTHNADVNFIQNNVLDVEAWLNKEERYKPVLISNEGYWRWNKRKWISFENGSEIECSFKTSPEVEKMSKSKLNVVTPDLICEQYGADCLRLYEMFLGPLEQHKPWNTNGISGVSGFLKKLWRLYFSPFEGGKGDVINISNGEANKAELKSLHKTIKKITDDIERFSFNTSVSNFMICVNELSDLKCNKREILEPLLILIAPYAPHICEELWALMGHTESITYAKWPEYNAAHTVDNSFLYPVSFNGKTRFKVELPLSLSIAEVEREVMNSDEVKKYLDDKQPKKVIVVHNKIVNVVL